MHFSFFMLLADTELPALPTPAGTDPAAAVIVVIVWILVVALVVGPLVHFFRGGGPRALTSQRFSDDPANRV